MFKSNIKRKFQSCECCRKIYILYLLHFISFKLIHLLYRVYKFSTNLDSNVVQTWRSEIEQIFKWYLHWKPELLSISLIVSILCITFNQADLFISDRKKNKVT